jgi:hypothetical protein
VSLLHKAGVAGAAGEAERTGSWIGGVIRSRKILVRIDPPLGLPNCAWLNTLKASIRSWSSLDSVSLVFLRRATSQLLIPGP